MVALVVSKLILVIIFVIGLGVLTEGLGQATEPGASTSATQSITQTIIGALILLMGGFAPFLAIRLVHFGGDHFAQVHGHAQASVAGAQSLAAAPQKAQKLAGQMGGIGASSVGSGAGGGSPSGGGGPSSPAVGSAARSSTTRSGFGATSAGAAAGAAAGLVGAAKGAVDDRLVQVGEASTSMADRASGVPSSGVRRADGSMAARAAHAVPPAHPAPSAPDRSETPDGGPPIGPPPPPKAR